MLGKQGLSSRTRAPRLALTKTGRKPLNFQISPRTPKANFPALGYSVIINYLSSRMCFKQTQYFVYFLFFFTE